MKRLYILLLSLIPLASWGQASQANSLKHSLQLSHLDTNRVLLLTKMAVVYRSYRSDSTGILATQALELARRLHYARGEGRALDALGIYWRDRSELPQALTILQQALAINRVCHDLESEASTLNSIGNIYLDLREFAKAISYYNQSRTVAEMALRKGIIFSGFYDVNSRINVELSNTANGYREMNKLDSARYVIQQLARRLEQNLLSNIEKNLFFRHLGNIEEKEGHMDRALHSYRQAIHFASLNEDYRNGGTAQFNLANLFFIQNKPDSSLRYALLAQTSLSRGSSKRAELNLTALLVKLYEKKGDIDSAFYYRGVQLAKQDSLYGPMKFQRLQQLALAEQQRQQELLATQKDYQNRIERYALLAGLAIVLLITFILYRNNRQKHQANQLLNEQKAKVEQTLETLRTAQTQLIQREKMASLGELTAGIAHEIQNPLNFVNNFSELSAELVEELKEEAQSGRIDQVLTLAGDIYQNLQKITHHGGRASSIVKGMLEHSRTSSGQKEPTDLNALADEYLRLAYQGQRNKDKTLNCELITDFAPDLPLVNVVSQDIGRVLLNLYNNAFYAVGQRARSLAHGVDYQPTIWVSTAQIVGHVEIRVKDNGMGIPESVKAKIFQPFFTTKHTGEGTGLGLSLSYDIVTKGHGGTLTVESQKGEGAVFTLKFSSQTN